MATGGVKMKMRYLTAKKFMTLRRWKIVEEGNNIKRWLPFMLMEVVAVNHNCTRFLDQAAANYQERKAVIVNKRLYKHRSPRPRRAELFASRVSESSVNMEESSVMVRLKDTT